MKDTDKVTLTLGQIKKLITESKGKKKMLKESGLSTGQDVIRDLVDRAQSIVEDGEEDTSEAVRQAIDEGLIYTDDILSLLRYYGTISDSEIIQSYYDELFDDVIKDVEIPEKDDEEDEEELTESGNGKWYVQCDPGFFHEKHCQTQKKIFDFMKKFDWNIPESEYPTMVKLAKSLGADGCIGFTMNEDESSCFLVFNNEEDALNWANILYDDGTSWPEDYVTDWLD